jgi:RNA polymerase sigma-70 factor (ECF subfamily)
VKPDAREASTKAMDPPSDRQFATPAGRDDDLVTRLARGDSAGAFDALVARYEGKVYRLCRSLLRDPAAAEDAAQDAFVRVWRALPRYDAASGALSTWIYAITRNRCLSLLGRRREPVVAMDEALEVHITEHVAAPAPPIAHDSIEALRALVEELPDGQRTAMLLFYYEERAVAEVASMLGLPEGTVKTHLHRGRAGLLERMKRRGLDDPAQWLEQGGAA